MDLILHARNQAERVVGDPKAEAAFMLLLPEFSAVQLGIFFHHAEGTFDSVTFGELAVAEKTEGEFTPATGHGLREETYGSTLMGEFLAMTTYGIQGFAGRIW